MQTEWLDVEVPGGPLRVARWGTGPRPVIAIHGITASSMSWLPVAREVGNDFSLFAPDLRGRGGSADLPGPFGMRAHAADCSAVLDHLGISQAVVAGHSMGAYVAVMLADQRPEAVDHLVLVDGGLPLPMPMGADPDDVLDAMLGPAMARLRLEFDSDDTYVEFWRAHPALADGWTDDVEQYVRYDLTGSAPTRRSRVSETAVRADGADTVANVADMENALTRVRCPISLLRAPRNLLNDHTPLLSDELTQAWTARLPQLDAELVPDTNHYTIAFGSPGAGRIAERIRQTPVRVLTTGAVESSPRS